MRWISSAIVIMLGTLVPSAHALWLVREALMR
jgi:hypothetical protein